MIRASISKEKYGYDSCYLLFIHIFLVDINISEIVSFKQKLKLEFKMEDLGPATRILGMKIKRDRVGNKLFLYQQLYISKVLN